MKITIAGYGFVGQAHNELLKDYHYITIVDPAWSEYNHAIPSDSEAVIVCVATPQRVDGACEMKHVYEVVESCPDVPILIKSTISLEGWQMLNETFPNRMLNFSPEFLRAQSAIEDMKNMSHMYMGGTSVNFWASVFNDCCNKLTIEVTDPEQLILGKYFRNSFLALKVAFFNQMYDLCKELDVNYEAVADVVGKDSRIGTSHTVVTEERGFGGHCFPKDTAAITRTAQKYNRPLTILERAIEYNNSIKKR